MHDLEAELACAAGVAAVDELRRHLGADLVPFQTTLLAALERAERGEALAWAPNGTDNALVAGACELCEAMGRARGAPLAWSRPGGRELSHGNAIEDPSQPRTSGTQADASRRARARPEASTASTSVPIREASSQPSTSLRVSPRRPSPLDGGPLGTSSLRWVSSVQAWTPPPAPTPRPPTPLPPRPLPNYCTPTTTPRRRRALHHRRRPCHPHRRHPRPPWYVSA